MPTSTANLMQKIYDLFSGIYATQDSGKAFLAFELAGLPLSADMFKLNDVLSPAMAVERLSVEIADAVMTAQGDKVERLSSTIDAMVEFLLVSSMPVDADGTEELGALKEPASRAFDGKLGSEELGRPPFHPVFATPEDWYVPTANDNWTQHTVGEQQSSTPPAHSAPAAVPPGQLHWRVLPVAMRPMLEQPIGQNHPLFSMSLQHPVGRVELSGPSAVPAKAVSHPITAMAMPAPHAPTPALAFPRWAFLPSLAKPIQPQPAATAPHPAPVPLRPLIVPHAVAQLHATTTPRPVASEAIEISFEHCIVTLNRPWFPQMFLMGRNWYLPGYVSGSFSTGAGVGDNGYLPLITSAFVAIRNLKISSKWSEQDLDAVQGSAALGPFSLVGRRFDLGTGTLTCVDTQIIAWFCQPLPITPPLSDPALATKPPQSAPATTSAAPASTGSPATAAASDSSPTGTPSAAASATSFASGTPVPVTSSTNTAANPSTTPNANASVISKPAL